MCDVFILKTLNDLCQISQNHTLRHRTELKWMKRWTWDTLHRLGPTVWSLSHRLSRSQWLFKTVVERTMLVFPSFYTWWRLVTIKLRRLCVKKNRLMISKICPVCNIQNYSHGNKGNHIDPKSGDRLIKLNYLLFSQCVHWWTLLWNIWICKSSKYLIFCTALLSLSVTASSYSNILVLNFEFCHKSKNLFFYQM